MKQWALKPPELTLTLRPAVAMLNVAAIDVPPAGAGFTTVTLAVPASARSAAGIAAVSWLEETKVVARAVPFQFTVELLTKLLPLTVNVMPGVPGAALDGLRLPRTGTGLPTVVMAVALLLPATESSEQEVRLAVLLAVPTGVHLTTRVTVAVARSGSAPRLQTTVLVPLQVPWLGVTEIKLAPAGSVSVMETPLAASGPLFVTRIV